MSENQKPLETNTDRPAVHWIVLRHDPGRPEPLRWSLDFQSSWPSRAEAEQAVVDAGYAVDGFDIREEQQ